jgi:hypothetical protein
MPSEETPWWMPLELLERNRFRVLEQLYALAGEDAEREVEIDSHGVARTLGITEADVSQAVAFLMHAHYLADTDAESGGAGGRVCFTRRAVYYLEAGAYQRRTIRD